ncbi:MAG: twin-arginine translocase TatA/TatE family subunit [Candidatus Kapabacteria bacterium]|jgi:sec-independent protein translocase protein TatA|nr:twin-arginine translocase TatA/TatE family subunit [Candidatus Kapabacteria bacterium]
MFDVGGSELILILLAVLVLFGPKKIPEFAKMMGKGMQKVKQAQSQFQEQMRDIQQEINTPAPTVNKTPPPPTTDNVMSENAKAIAAVSDVPAPADAEAEINNIPENKSDSEDNNSDSIESETKEEPLPKEIIDTRSGNKPKIDPPNQIEL